MINLTRGSMHALDPFVTNRTINLRAVYLHLWWRGTRFELQPEGI